MSSPYGDPRRGDFKLCRKPHGALVGDRMGASAVLRCKVSGRGRAWAMGTAGWSSAARCSGLASECDSGTRGYGSSWTGD